MNDSKLERSHNHPMIRSCLVLAALVCTSCGNDDGPGSKLPAETQSPTHESTDESDSSDGQSDTPSPGVDASPGDSEPAATAMTSAATASSAVTAAPTAPPVQTPNPVASAQGEGGAPNTASTRDQPPSAEADAGTSEPTDDNAPTNNTAPSNDTATPSSSPPATEPPPSDLPTAQCEHLIAAIAHAKDFSINTDTGQYDRHLLAMGWGDVVRRVSTYQTSGDADHTHFVRFTEEELDALLDRKSVTVTTDGPPSNAETGHSHTILVSACPDPEGTGSR